MSRSNFLFMAFLSLIIIGVTMMQACSLAYSAEEPSDGVIAAE